MKKLVGLLLVLSVSLYSTPLRADSYESNETVLTDCDNTNSDCNQCEVTSETFVQNTSEEPLIENESSQKDLNTQETYVDNSHADQETLVSPENPEQNQTTRSKRWQNIFLAIAVVAVAITACLLVNSHQGHKHH